MINYKELEKLGVTLSGDKATIEPVDKNGIRVQGLRISIDTSICLSTRSVIQELLIGAYYKGLERGKKIKLNN